MNTFFKNKVAFKLSISLAVIAFAMGCSRKDSSTESSSSGGQTGFEVTPPATNDPTQGNNPGTNPGTNPGNPTNPDDEFENQYVVVLNGGAAYTQGQQLTLAIEAPVTVKSIKVGQTRDCSDGTVENIKPEVTKPVFKRNAVNLVSTQFISFSGKVLACVVKSITQDDQGPDVLISQYPLANLEEGANAEIKYSVSDVSPIKEVNCSLNDVVKPCASGDAAVKLTTMTEGSYTFKVTAKDIHGFTSEKSVSWKVVNSYKKVHQSVDIKNERKVDILMVIDNSTSMEYEQQSMAKRVGNMLKVIKDLDWQIAVTTTDPRNVNLGDGRLIPIYPGNLGLFLKSSMDMNEAQTNLGMTLQRPEQGSGSEQPINATYRFIERALGKDTAYKKFFRDNSNFAVIVISDEDESDNQFRNDPKNLINLVSTSFNQQKVFTWHSIITKPGDAVCRKTNGAAYGERLARFSEMTGGIVGSVCEADYASQVTGIANGIVNMSKSISLTCEALKQYPIVVKKDGVVYTKPYVQEGINLKFADFLEAGNYEVEYTCLK